MRRHSWRRRLVVAFSVIGPTAFAQVDPSTYAGVYTVSETDPNATRCEPTPFRAALATGQPGPGYQYRVRVTIAAPDVNFSAENGAALFSATLTTGGKFTETSGAGFSVVGEFASGGFRMTWVRPPHWSSSLPTGAWKGKQMTEIITVQTSDFEMRLS